MMKTLRLIAASAASMLAAGCVAYPYYDEPYDSGGYAGGGYAGGGYAYAAPAPVVVAPPAVSFRYYDYDDHYYARPQYRGEYHAYRGYDQRGGRNWRSDGKNYRRDDRRSDHRSDGRDHHDHRYYDGR